MYGYKKQCHLANGYNKFGLFILRISMLSVLLWDVLGWVDIWVGFL